MTRPPGSQNQQLSGDRKWTQASPDQGQHDRENPQTGRLRSQAYAGKAAVRAGSGGRSSPEVTVTAASRLMILTAAARRGLSPSDCTLRDRLGALWLTSRRASRITGPGSCRSWRPGGELDAAAGPGHPAAAAGSAGPDRGPVRHDAV